MMNKKLIMLLSVIIAIVMLTNGCGSGGGSGRYTIPPEVPTTGAGGAPPGIGGVGETDPESLTLSAWGDFENGAYSTAIHKFNEVLATPGISEAQKAKAYNGLGWAKTKTTGVASAFSDFRKAAPTINEARVGLASALIHRGGNQDFKEAVHWLEEVGLNDTTYMFQSNNPIGVSNAGAHAMLAFCYFWRNESGDDVRARSQIVVARGEDGSNDSSVAQIYQSLKDLGLSGI